MRGKKGTKSGDMASERWRDTMKEKHGENWREIMREQGKKGGKASSNGGFYANRELAKTAGGKGGQRSSRDNKLKVYGTYGSISELRLVLDKDESEGMVYFVIDKTMTIAKEKLKNDNIYRFRNYDEAELRADAYNKGAKQ